MSPRFGKQIFDALTNRGEIFIRRIYGNWEKNILHGWNDCILNFALRPVQQIDFVAGKNATDMLLTIDAMDILYGEQVEIFALVSNDSDFTPLAIRLREGGMTVVGLGNEHAANAFRLACSEFVDLDALAAVPAPVEKILPVPVAEKPKVVSISERQLQSDRDKKIQQLHDVLREVAKIHGDAQGFTPLCWAGQSLHEKNLGFGVKDLGYSFQSFVAAFPEIYEVIHRTNGENYCYRLRTDEPKVSIDDDAEKIRRIHDVLREAAEVHGGATGFLLLNFAGQKLKSENLGYSVRDFDYHSLQNFVESFPKLYEMQTTCNMVSYRLRTDAPKTSVDEQKQLISADKQNRLQTLHDVLREAAETYRDSDGFTLLNHAGAAIKIKNLGYSIKDFGYNQLHDFVAAFPELYETAHDTINQKFRYRCK